MKITSLCGKVFKQMKNTELKIISNHDTKYNHIFMLIYSESYVEIYKYVDVNIANYFSIHVVKCTTL